MGARTEGGTEGKEGETEDLGSNSTNDSSMAWRGVVAPNSSDNRGGASLATVAVVEEVLGGRAEGVVVDLPGGGAVVQSLSTPPAPGGYVFPPSYPSHLPRPQGSAPAFHPDDPRERCHSCNQIGHRHLECPAHVVNRTDGRGFGRAKVVITSEFRSYENESVALQKRLEQLEQLQLPTYDHLQRPPAVLDVARPTSAPGMPVPT